MPHVPASWNYAVCINSLRRAVLMSLSVSFMKIFHGPVTCFVRPLCASNSWIQVSCCLSGSPCLFPLIDSRSLTDALDSCAPVRRMVYVPAWLRHGCHTAPYAACGRALGTDCVCFWWAGEAMYCLTLETTGLDNIFTYQQTLNNRSFCKCPLGTWDSSALLTMA
jgi:hypothetical protein